MIDFFITLVSTERGNKYFYSEFSLYYKCIYFIIYIAKLFVFQPGMVAWNYNLST